MRWSAIWLLVAVGCTPSAPPQQPCPPAPPAAVSPSPSPPVLVTPSDDAEPRRVANIEMYWGTVGVSDARRPSPYWVMGQVRFDAGPRAGVLRLVDAVVYDRAGERIGTMMGEPEVRPVPRELPGTALARPATAPFDGRLAASTALTLWIRVRLDEGFAAKVRRIPTTVTVGFELDGETLEASGDLLGSWPTG